MVFNVKVLGRKLRRTANEDLKLVEGSTEPKFTSLSSTINGLIAIEAAFASVTVAVLLVIVGIIISGVVTIPEDVVASIALFVIAALTIATICWIISLEMLSHLISPSLADKAFRAVYQEALNLWNLGLMLLIFSLCLVLIPIHTGVAASVTAFTTLLSVRALCLVHQWGPVTLKDMQTRKREGTEAVERARSPWLFSVGMSVAVLLLSSLYVPLNRATDSVWYAHTPIDDWIPLWPVFVLPYVSYFAYILGSAIVAIWRRDRVTYERLVLALIFTLAVSLVVYGFFQSGMVRPDLSGSSDWLTGIVRQVYGTDHPYNAFPSSHASITTVCCLALCRWRRIRVAAIVWGILIVASTVLVKQHYVADALAGVTLGSLAFWAAGWLRPIDNASG